MPITYCIVCNITGEKYYGSTKSTLNVRINNHKCKLTCSSKQIILRGDYDIYPLGEYDTIEEAEMKEKWYIDNKECINKNRVRVTDEERKEEKGIYYQKNKENILKKRKEYCQKNKEKIKQYNNELSIKYYNKNKEQINEKRKEKVECEFCKSIMRISSISKHQKTKKCKKFQ